MYIYIITVIIMRISVEKCAETLLEGWSSRLLCSTNEGRDTAAGGILNLPMCPSGKRMVRTNESRGDGQLERAPSPLTLVQVGELLA